MCCRHSHGCHAPSAPSPHHICKCVVPATIGLRSELSGSTSAYFHSKLHCRHLLRDASAHRVRCCCRVTTVDKTASLLFLSTNNSWIGHNWLKMQWASEIGAEKGDAFRLITQSICSIIGAEFWFFEAEGSSGDTAETKYL